MSMSSEETHSARKKDWSESRACDSDYIKKSVNIFSGKYDLESEWNIRRGDYLPAILYDFAGEGIRGVFFFSPQGGKKNPGF